jgi:hypothetical protein
MDIESYDHVEAERNGTATNSDRYITPVEYQVNLHVDLLT